MMVLLLEQRRDMIKDASGHNETILLLRISHAWNNAAGLPPLIEASEPAACEHHPGLSSSPETASHGFLHTGEET